MDDLVDQLKNFFTNNSRRVSFTQINDQARRASLESNKPSSVAGIITPVHITHSITDSQIGHIKDELSSSERCISEAKLKEFRITGTDSVDMLSVELCRKRLLQHLSRLFQNKDIKFNRENDVPTIEIVGTTQQQASVMNYLSTLFESIQMKLYDDKQNGSWVRIEDVIDFLQFHFDRSDMICCWKRISIDVIAVKYYSTSDDNISTDEKRIHNLICKQFAAANLSYNQTKISDTLIKKFNEILETVRTQDYYKNSIVLSHQKSFIYLFGIHDQIKQIFGKLYDLKKKYNLTKIQPQLSEKQWKYVSIVCKHELTKLQQRYRENGSNVNLDDLLSDKYLIVTEEIATDIICNLRKYFQIEDLQFTMIGSSLVTWIRTNIDRLTQIYSSKCLIEYKTTTEIEKINVPQAPVSDQMQRFQNHRLAKGHMMMACKDSTIQVIPGDLVQQQVDMIVVNAASTMIVHDILRQAAGTVNQELEHSRENLKIPIVTSSGRLPCKQIAFIPFEVFEHANNSLDSALKSFLNKTIECATTHNCKSLAIPSVFYEKLGYQPSAVAHKMITITKDILESGDYQMNLLLVISPSDRDIFHAFNQYVEKQSVDSLQQTDSVSNLQPSKTLEHRKIKTTIILTGSNRNSLLTYKNEIEEMASSKTVTEILHNKNDLDQWTQPITDAFYHFCLGLDVTPRVDFLQKTIVLDGTRVATQRCQLHYIELNNRLLDQACILATSSGITWLFETTLNSNDWQEFTIEHNAVIENAFLKRKTHIEISINSSTTIRIDFSKMESRTRQCVQRIQRWNKNSILPKTWNLSRSKSNRFILSINAKEYSYVRNRFNVTMRRVTTRVDFHRMNDSDQSSSQYTEIISIERIQNEEWYTQFYTLREDFVKKGTPLNEELLFHGCTEPATHKIIEECFNRSYAGNNDGQHGHGVCFHRDAISSHEYAVANQNGERRMFLARVLIGKSYIGDTTTKLLPTGFHSATDGNKVFVIYDDANAYAEYLITYA